VTSLKFCYEAIVGNVYDPSALESETPPMGCQYISGHNPVDLPG